MCITSLQVFRGNFSFLHKPHVPLLSLLQLLLPLLPVLLAEASVVGGYEYGVVFACVGSGKRVWSARRDQAVRCRVGHTDASLQACELLADGVSRQGTATVGVWNLEAFLTDGMRIHERRVASADMLTSHARHVTSNDTAKWFSSTLSSLCKAQLICEPATIAYSLVNISIEIREAIFGIPAASHLMSMPSKINIQRRHEKRSWSRRHQIKEPMAHHINSYCICRRRIDLRMISSDCMNQNDLIFLFVKVARPRPTQICHLVDERTLPNDRAD